MVTRQAAARYSASDDRIQQLLHDWHESGRAAFEAQYKALKYDRERQKRATDRQKYIALDEGHSGAWLVDRATGDVYNIKSKYGVPDKSKRLGHIDTVTGEELHQYRWWYKR